MRVIPLLASRCLTYDVHLDFERWFILCPARTVHNRIANLCETSPYGQGNLENDLEVSLSTVWVDICQA